MNGLIATFYGTFLAVCPSVSPLVIVGATETASFYWLMAALDSTLLRCRSGRAMLERMSRITMSPPARIVGTTETATVGRSIATVYATSVFHPVFIDNRRVALYPKEVTSMFVSFHSYGGVLVEGTVENIQRDMMNRRVVTLDTKKGREVWTFLNDDAWARANGAQNLFPEDLCVRPQN